MSRNTTPAKAIGVGHDQNHPLSIILNVAESINPRANGPRCLWKYKGGRILEMQTSTLRNIFPNSEIIVVVGQCADNVVAHFPNLRIVENENFAQTNSSRSIALGLRLCQFPHVLIIDGNLLWNDYALNELTKNGSSVLINSSEEGLYLHRLQIGCIQNGPQILKFDFTSPRKFSKIAFISPTELVPLRNFVYNREHDKAYLFEALDCVAAKGGWIEGVEIAGNPVIEFDSQMDLI